MEKPTVEQVLKASYDLYDNPDVSAKERASSWLNDFQKSVNFQVFFSLNVIKVDINITHRLRSTRGRYATSCCC